MLPSSAGDEIHAAWKELARLLAGRGRGELVDLYVERRLEVTWQLQAGGARPRVTVHQDGVAVRRVGTLLSHDGVERVVVAELAGVPVRALPTLLLPHFPEPPGVLPETLPHGHGAVAARYLWRWSTVVSGAGATFPTRPDLLELTFPDGGRAVTVWPPLPTWRPERSAPGRTVLRAGRVVALLAPQPAAVLLHELLGHGLEGDLLRHGASPWVGRLGERVTGVALEVTDDPTRDDLAGAFDVDDEGVPAAPRTLLSDGVLVAALGTKLETAAGVPPGNARRATVHTPPRPRVSNLVVAAPTALPEPPRHEADVEVLAVSAGHLEPRRGTVWLSVRQAYALRRGQRARVLAPFTLLGDATAVCRGLLAAAGQAEPVAEPGWCGKEGEVVPTSAVAPWLLASNLEAR